MVEKYNAVLKLILYSVHGERGRKKCIEVVCRGLTYEKYCDTKWKIEKSGERYQCKKGEVLVRKAETVADNLGINGVPSFYLEDGTLISGANLKALEIGLQKLRKSEK